MAAECEAEKRLVTSLYLVNSKNWRGKMTLTLGYHFVTCRYPLERQKKRPIFHFPSKSFKISNKQSGRKLDPLVLGCTAPPPEIIYSFLSFPGGVLTAEPFFGPHFFGIRKSSKR